MFVFVCMCKGVWVGWGGGGGHGKVDEQLDEWDLATSAKYRTHTLEQTQ